MGGGGGTDFSAGVGGLSGGPSTSALLSAPIGGNGYLSPTTSPGLLSSIGGALPQIAKTFQGGIGGLGGAAGGGNPAAINSRAGGVSNAVGQGEPMANLFGQMNSPNGLDHLWQQAFGPSPMPNVLNGALSKTMGGY